MDQNTTLTWLEYEALTNAERDIQSKQQIKASRDETCSVIHYYKKNIRHFTNNAPQALLFFDLLERERWQSNALEAYQAGKEASAQGLDPETGLNIFLRDWFMCNEVQDLARDLERAFQVVRNLMPLDLQEDYAQCLLDTYRECFPSAATHAERFFEMGYHAFEEAGTIANLLLDEEEYIEAQRRAACPGSDSGEG